MAFFERLSRLGDKSSENRSFGGGAGDGGSGARGLSHGETHCGLFRQQEGPLRLSKEREPQASRYLGL